MKTKYYKKLDFIRLFSCMAILFYHVGILKGGYLAVCTFFVLSGYLAIISSFKKEKFSLKEYYKTRFKKIYLPLILVIFISIAIISLIPNNNWINLKSETTSVILGYNNYWQLNANLDYFVRYNSSPFIHFWFIAILIQFEIVFPIIFLLLKKIGEKINKIIPCIILLIISVLSYILFFINVKNNNIMFAYYDTFSRIFSITFGLLLGFIHVYFKPLAIKNKKINKILFVFYLILLLILFIFVDNNSYLFNISMILTTLISVRLIENSLNDNKTSNINLIVTSLSKFSYELYLVQYPIIYLFNNLSIVNYIKVVLIIFTTIIIANIIHKIIKNKVKKIFLILVILSCLFGIFKYITFKDYTDEINTINEELNKNSLLIEEKQNEYENNEQKSEENFIIDNKNKDDQVKEIVSNLKIVGVGDSILQMVVNDLYKVFPSGYFDGKKNRTEPQGRELLKKLKGKNIIDDVVLIVLGTNGNCTQKCKDTLYDVIPDKKIFWVNATNPDYDTFNPGLEEFANRHDNVYIIDWVSVCKEHPEYLYGDKVHPNVKGSKAFANFVYDEIYKVYFNEYNN